MTQLLEEKTKDSPPDWWGETAKKLLDKFNSLCKKILEEKHVLEKENEKLKNKVVELQQLNQEMEETIYWLQQEKKALNCAILNIKEVIKND